MQSICIGYIAFGYARSSNNCRVHQRTLQNKIYLLTWMALVAGDKHHLPSFTHSLKPQRHSCSLPLLLQDLSLAVRPKSKMKHKSETLPAGAVYIKISVCVPYQPGLDLDLDFEVHLDPSYNHSALQSGIHLHQNLVHLISS